MLISHKYRFIFVKTVKTAGTSIEVDLSRVMEDGDVVTPIFPAEGGHRPRNYVVNGVELFNHVSAMVIRDSIGVDFFGQYFKFCVEREPVDKCLSHYWMLRNSPFHNQGMEFISWDEYLQRREFPVDYQKYVDEKGGLMVNKIIHYERLGVELRETMQKLGCPFEGLRSRAKSDFRDGSQADRRVTLKDAEVIYESFLPSNEYTGYRIDEFAKQLSEE